MTYKCVVFKFCVSTRLANRVKLNWPKGLAGQPGQSEPNTITYFGNPTKNKRNELE
jgi:hypothetical protein